RKRTDGGDDLCLDGPGPVGYLRVEQINGSTPQELRALARRLEDQGARALILDLRSAMAGLHPTVLLADSLLDGGTIRPVRTGERVETLRAEPDALFPGWPLAVLVDESTDATAVWLAAALQDNRRAVVVGTGNARVGIVRTVVPVGVGDWSVDMPTGRL